MNWRTSDTIVAVIGDHCLDKDYCGDFGKVMSREQDDMAIFESSRMGVHYSGGGAANIVDLLQHWGVRVLPVGVWNPLHDPNSRELLNRWQTGFVDTRYMVEGYGTPTYVKYYTKEGKHIFRANEAVAQFEPKIESKIHQQLCRLSQCPIDIVIVADYDENGNGVLSNYVLEAIRQNIKCPKIGLSRQRIVCLKDYDYLILNEEELTKEVDDTLGPRWIRRANTSKTFIDLGSIEIFTATNAGSLLVTLEGKGTILYDWLGNRNDAGHAGIIQTLVSSQPQDGKINVCGCGDTFVAAFAICLASGMDEVEAIKRANAAARVQTRQLFGARTVDSAEWEREYQLLYGDIENG